MSTQRYLSTLLWTVAWAFLAHDNPKLHPNITQEVNMSRVESRWEETICRSLLRSRRSLLDPKHRHFPGVQSSHLPRFGGSSLLMPPIHLVCTISKDADLRKNKTLWIIFLILFLRSFYPLEIRACLPQVSYIFAYIMRNYTRIIISLWCRFHEILHQKRIIFV